MISTSHQPVDVDTPASAWDAEYTAGRYVAEPPLPFVETILSELRKRPGIHDRRGLYVGCGNGRNYVPLAKAGLDIIGLDVSAVGLGQIAAREPSLAPKLVRGDFLGYGGRFGYVVAIQSFQHGTQSTSERYFRRAAAVLERGGLLFVRVNGADTDIIRPHQTLEKSGAGFTARYLAGPKSGLHVRFYTEEGLRHALWESGMRVISGPVNVVTKRVGQRGSWAQWEIVAALGDHR